MNISEGFVSRGKYRYIYSSLLNDFILVPDHIEKTVNNKNDTTDIFVNKFLFLKEKGVLQTDSPPLETEYAPLYIESNLANLRQLLIEVTDGCNLACKYCGYGSMYGNYDKRTGIKQDFVRAKKMIDFLVDLWRSHKNISTDKLIYIGFYGGEPLMNFSLIRQVIDYLEQIELKDLSFQYNMTTNAILLSQYIDYIVEKKFKLLISLDGTKENNSYRVTKSGKESFKKVYANVCLLKEKYPEYFDAHVNFNAVLHDRNSFASTYKYIKETFNKTPRIAELNSNGIVEEKKKEFYGMFTGKSASYRQFRDCEETVIEEINIDPQIMQLNTFMEAYSGNTFKTVPDLFFSKTSQTYLPTGTCPPFYKKLFLTVNGKILPCEKIGQDIPLGYVDKNGVHLDADNVKLIYKNLYGYIIDTCKKCLRWKDCGICIYNLPKDKKGRFSCPYSYKTKELNHYFSEQISMLEDHPELYEQITKEIMVDF